MRLSDGFKVGNDAIDVEVNEGLLAFAAIDYVPVLRGHDRHVKHLGRAYCKLSTEYGMSNRGASLPSSS